MKAFFLALSFLYLCSCSSTGKKQYITGSPYFMWPVKKGTLTQKFKKRSKKHEGIDIAARKNTPIYASESGKVLYAGREFNGYGKLIIIEHKGDTWASFYAHLNSFNVGEGQYVRKGQVIGVMGRTGRATGVHLHFEIRHNLRAVDPLDYLSRRALLTKR